MQHVHDLDEFLTNTKNCFLRMELSLLGSRLDFYDDHVDPYIFEHLSQLILSHYRVYFRVLACQLSL